MSRDLHEKIGSVTPENLFAGLDPRALTKAGVLRKLGTAATLVRGTLLAKSSGSAGDGKLVIFGTTAATNETLTADCVLAEDVEVGTAADENALVFITGNFNEDELTLASGASLTEADRDALRVRGILLGASETESVTA
jgi:hypothetical protein